MTTTRRRPASELSDQAWMLHEYGVLPETRELWFRGDFEIETCDKFIRNLRFLEALNDQPVVIHLCSPGGDPYAAMGVYDAIHHSTCYITSLSHGLAASMATVVPQAADSRVIMPNATVLVHYGYETISGTAVEARSTSNWYDKLNREMLYLYANRCKGAPMWKRKSAAQIVGEIDRTLREQSDWYMTAHQSVDYGFFDSVLDCPVQSLLE